MAKLVVGTANFDQYYGHGKHKICTKDISRIIQTLKKNKINYIDTALDYKLSKKTFGFLKYKNFKIINKIRLPKSKILNFIEKLEKKVNIELNKYKVKNFESLLIHDCRDLQSKYFDEMINKLFYLKKKKLIKKIGVSIYTPKDLFEVLKKFKPDLIQLPLNIFDQKFTRNKIVNIFKKYKILVQVRSIFLQGIIFKNLSEIQNLSLDRKIKNKLISFQKWCDKKNTSKLEASIQFIKQFKFINYITIGVNNKKQLEEIIKVYNSNNKLKIKNFSSINENFIDPRKW